MEVQRNQYHLILDRQDAKNPRWVIAKEYVSRPANLPDGFTIPPDATWLREVGIPEFEWLRRVFGRDTYVSVTQRGRESYSTRLSPRGGVWPEHTVPVDQPAHRRLTLLINQPPLWLGDDPDYAGPYDGPWGADFTDPGWDEPNRVYPGVPGWDEPNRVYPGVPAWDEPDDPERWADQITDD